MMVAGHVWVFRADDGWVRCTVMCLVAHHSSGDADGEFLYLFSDVTKEGVAGPSSYQHDGVDRDVVKMHRHGAAGTDGMCANVSRS